MLVLLIIGMAGRTRAPDSGRSGPMGGQQRRIWCYTEDVNAVGVYAPPCIIRGLAAWVRPTCAAP